MTIAVITGGRDRTPTLFELGRLAEIKARRGITTARHGSCPPRKVDGKLVGSTDTFVAAWLKARGLVKVEAWPADWVGLGKAAGPVRNRAMLEGDSGGELFGSDATPPADVLIAFRGGRGTADCTAAALERGIPVEFIADADEPRPWNRHHGDPPGPATYVGRGSPLGNPYPLELGDGEIRATAVERVLSAYKAWLWTKLRPGPKQDQAVVRALRDLTPQHYAVCSCWPNHCHAEIVIKAWRWLQTNRETGG